MPLFIKLLMKKLIDARLNAKRLTDPSSHENFIASVRSKNVLMKSKRKIAKKRALKPMCFVVRKITLITRKKVADDGRTLSEKTSNSFPSGNFCRIEKRYNAKLPPIRNPEVVSPGKYGIIKKINGLIYANDG